MLFQRRWLSLSLLLVLIACDAAHASPGARKEVVPQHEGTARSIAAPAPRRCRNSAATAPGRRDIWLTDTSMLLVCLDLGQVLRIDLPATPAIGYEWVLEDGVPPLLRMETDPGNAPTSHLSTRTGSVQTWGFRADRSGHTVLRFAYRRPWEASPVPMRTAQFEIIVH